MLVVPVSLDYSGERRTTHLPSLFAVSSKAEERFWEFFAANIGNRNTRQAYYVAVCRFAGWCSGAGLELPQARPIHVATYIEKMGQAYSKASVKQRLAAVR